MIYKGSCHCGRVAYEAEGEIKGSLLWFVPRDKFRLLTPEQQASTYTFNKHMIKHRFCPVCGIHPYAEAADRSGKPMAAINVRCVEGVELSSLAVKHFDGRAL